MQRSSLPGPTQIRGPSSKSKLACQRCRDRHVKCDQKQPCWNCKRQKIECDYGSHHLFTPLEWQPETSIESPINWPTAFLTPAVDSSSDFVDETATVADQYTVVRDVTKNVQIDSSSREQFTRSPSITSEHNNSLPFRSVSNGIAIDHAYRSNHSCSPHASKLMSESALTNAREASLLSHYAAVIAPWFDVFDTNVSYFSTEVPLQALHNRLLRLACLAAASKQQSLVTGHAHSESIGYYHNGIQALYAALGDDQAKKDPATFASCILIAFCEMIESNAANWVLHLKGTRDLLQFNGWNASTGGLGGACFWIFCRPTLMACLSSGQPVPFEIPNVVPIQHLRQTPTWTFESWANKATHLLAAVHNLHCRTRNFLGASEIAHYTEEWKHLKRELTAHEKERPSMCHPIAILPPQSGEVQPFAELRYLNGSVAGAMQVLDTASLLHVLSFPCRQADRVMYLSRTEVSNKALHYARNVISNSISNRHSMAWVNGVQLLETAGRCLIDWKERSACLTILQDIQRETGWNTRENMKILLTAWDWNGMEKFDAWKNIRSNNVGNSRDLGQCLYAMWKGDVHDSNDAVDEVAGVTAVQAASTPEVLSGTYFPLSLGSTPSSQD